MTVHVHSHRQKWSCGLATATAVSCPCSCCSDSNRIGIRGCKDCNTEQYNNKLHLKMNIFNHEWVLLLNKKTTIWFIKDKMRICIEQEQKYIYSLCHASKHLHGQRGTLLSQSRHLHEVAFCSLFFLHWTHLRKYVFLLKLGECRIFFLIMIAPFYWWWKEMSPRWFSITSAVFFILWYTYQRISKFYEINFFIDFLFIYI